MPRIRDQVFISYSHKDKRWRNDLDTNLKPYVRNGSIVGWSDQQIAPGSEWFKEIQSALTNSRVAVLLVSPDFLASDFIHEHEFGPLLKEAEQGGVKILWVPVRESAYKQTLLKNYQALVDSGKPLAGMTRAKRDQAWVKICEEIQKAVELRRLADAVKTTGEAVQKQEKEIRDQREVIRLIYEALRRSLTKYEYQHLVELESGAPSPNYRYTDFLLNEMIRLCQHGYATETFDQATWRMKEQGDGRFDLKDFYRITDEGKNHLEQLRKLEALILHGRSEDEV